MGRVCTTAREDRVINKIIVDCYINREAFFDNNIKEELPLQNGIFNLIDMKLSPFTPKKIFFAKLPIKYDNKADCPMIKKHFDTVLNKKNDIKIIQEFFGFCLWKEYFVEKSIMLLGEGRNGKGKTLELLKTFLGVENVTNLSLYKIEQDKYSCYGLFGKLANISGDIGVTAIKNTGNFKELTGRDNYNASRKYKNSINFVNYAKMIFACNELPKIRDNTAGWWERWGIVDFPYTFLTEQEINELPEEERENKKLIDINIMDKMTKPTELSGLFNWALIGLNRMREQKNFSFNSTSQTVARKWKANADSLGLFFDDFITYGTYDDYITKDDFKRVYIDFCKSINGKIENESVIGLFMREHQVSSKRLSSGQRLRAWEGIKFNKSVQGVQDVHSNPKSTKGDSQESNGKTMVCEDRVDGLNEFLEENIETEEVVVEDTNLHKCINFGKEGCEGFENVRFRNDKAGKPICDKCYKKLGCVKQ